MPYVCYHILYEFLYYPQLVFSMLLGKKGGGGGRGQHFTTKGHVYQAPTTQWGNLFKELKYFWRSECFQKLTLSNRSHDN